MPAKTNAPTTASQDLQNLLADVSAAIAGGESWGRAKLEVLRRKLDAARTQLRQDERAATSTRLVLADVVSGIDSQVADLAGVADRARKLANLPAEQVQG